mmetsp:Transcript_2993/g.5223  ORF Transcript_2993/g.5223 Transcript_2993/m.5223 type:complete len:186 (+) Transcript_2993:62-619(+)
MKFLLILLLCPVAHGVVVRLDDQVPPDCSGTITGVKHTDCESVKLEDCANAYTQVTSGGTMVQCGVSGPNCLSVGPVCSPTTTTSTTTTTIKRCSGAEYKKIPSLHKKHCEGMINLGDRDANGGLFGNPEKCVKFIKSGHERVKKCDGLYFAWHSRDFWWCRCSTTGGKCQPKSYERGDVYEICE